MEKFASLASLGEASAASETLTLLVPDGLLGTVQGYVPVFPVLAMTVDQELPELVENSSLTFPENPTDLQSIFLLSPTY